MSVLLNNIAPAANEKSARKRVGRGIGSGKGKTCGRGEKGQKARSGVAIKGFEGGQTPIHRRLPKRGFNNPCAANITSFTIRDLNKYIESGAFEGVDIIDRNVLAEKSLISKKYQQVKLIGGEKVSAKVKVQFTKISASALKAIQAAKGEFIQE